MEKNSYLHCQQNDPQPQYKKIQDYVYRFSDQIGTGNFSKVFKGYHQNSNKEVAIKIIQLNSLNSPKVQELLNSQTKILKTLSHPNIIGCEQILSSIRNCYIIMQLCQGGDLQKQLHKVGKFSQHELIPIAVDVYEGLRYLRDKNIVHRDIKTSNIFINRGVHKIADFGFAQISQYIMKIFRNQFRDVSVGSPIYMSPQGYINNIYGPKTDVWAFGVLLFELIEGRTPCHWCHNETDLKEHLVKRIQERDFYAGGVSMELKELIMRCLEVQVNARIDVVGIGNSQWMKMAYRAMNRQGGSGSSNRDAITDMSKSYKQPYQLSQELHPKQSMQLPPANDKSTTRSIFNTKDSREVCFKNYCRRYNKIMDHQRRQHTTDLSRKYSTLEKPQHRVLADQVSVQKKPRNEPTGIFYSPRNLPQKLQKVSSNRTDSPGSKFQSLYWKNSLRNQEIAQGKYRERNATTEEFYHGDDDRWRYKYKGEKLGGMRRDLDYSEKVERVSSNNKDKCMNNDKVYELCRERNREQQKLLKKQTQSANLKTMINSSSPTSHNSKSPSGKYGEWMEKKVLRNTNYHNLPEKQERHKNGQMYKEVSSNLNTNQQKIINRIMKFADCISLIHYCRLCYKFISLLAECGEDEPQTKRFLIGWSVQLLQQLNTKIQRNEIIYCNDISLSIDKIDQHQKKKKLRDVTRQYLSRYTSTLNPHQSFPFISLKQSSTFIYNLYLLKGHEFKQRTHDKKPQIYFALICYVSVLDRETRNLMEFVYEIKGGLDGRLIERLLGNRISQFCRRSVEEIVSQNVENVMMQEV